MHFKPSANPKVIELTKSVKERRVNLDVVRPIKIEEELNAKGKNKRLCAWCAVEELSHGNQKYCSMICSNSAMAWANPQKEDSLRFLLVKQEWKCAHCQFDYKPVMEAIMLKERAKRPYAVAVKDEIPLESLPWFYFKRLKNSCPKANKPEVDHITAIFKGGNPLERENLQIICKSCHLKKTKRDLSGPRDK